MKWLARLSPQAEPQKGFYMDTAYQLSAPARRAGRGVQARGDEAGHGALRQVELHGGAGARQGGRGASTLRGFAFSGAPDIAKVEVSDDGGATWRAAALDPQHDPYAWRLWSFRCEPKAAGTGALLARATDSRGSVQPREAVWNQSGYLYNAWHAAAVEVTA